MKSFLNMESGCGRRLIGSLWYALVAAMGSLPAMAQEIHTTDTEEPVADSGWVEIRVGEVVLEDMGSAAQLRQDFGLREGGSGGLERYTWVQTDSGDWNVRIDARVVENPDTINFNLKLEQPEEQLLQLTFRHWTLFDNAVGPWYSPNAVQALLTPQELENKLNQLTVRYEKTLTDTLRMELVYRLFRSEGERLSTRYGDDFQFRIGGRPSRGIIPAIQSSEETTQTVDARFIWQDWVKLTGVRVHAQRREVDHERIVERGANDRLANRWTRQAEHSTDDLFSLSAFSRREWGDSIIGSMGFAFTRLDGDLSGSRIFGSAPEAAFDPEFAALQFEDRGFLDLESTRQLRQWIFNLNLVTIPGETVRWMAGLRLEKMRTEVFGSYLDTYSTVDWAAPALQREEADMLTDAEKDMLDVSAFVEVRYRGFSKCLLFARLEAASQEGDLDEIWIREEIFPDTRDAVSLLDRATDYARKTGFLEAGAHYYPFRNLHFSLKGYLKYRRNGYSLPGVELPDADYTLYPGNIIRQMYTTSDINGRITWSVRPGLKLLSRIDYQESQIENTGRDLLALDSTERRRVVFNQNVTWRPGKRFFFSANYSLVKELTETRAADLEGVFSGIVSDLPSDYWQVDVTAYMVLTKRIDLQLGYQYMELDAYLNSAPKTIAYGSDMSLETASAGLVLHFTEAVRCRLEYRQFERCEPSSVGLNDYQAHLVSGTFQLIF